MGWQVIMATPLYVVAWYWPIWSKSVLEDIGLGGWNPIAMACAMTLTALLLIYVILIVVLIAKRIAIGVRSVEVIVDEHSREDTLGDVSDNIDDTYRIHASWVHLSVASVIAAIAWWQAGSMEAALAHGVAAVISTLFAPRGARYVVRKMWQRIGHHLVEHERSKNPWTNNGNHVGPRRRNKEIAD